MIGDGGDKANDLVVRHVDRQYDLITILQ
jgi:hypothetical protein